MDLVISFATIHISKGVLRMSKWKRLLREKIKWRDESSSHVAKKCWRMNEEGRAIEQKREEKQRNRVRKRRDIGEKLTGWLSFPKIKNVSLESMCYLVHRRKKGGRGIKKILIAWFSFSLPRAPFLEHWTNPSLSTQSHKNRTHKFLLDVGGWLHFFKVLADIFSILFSHYFVWQ